MRNSLRQSPQFDGPSQYLEHVLGCLASWKEQFSPETLDELPTMLNEQPEYARRWLPPTTECKRLGIAPHIATGVSA